MTPKPSEISFLSSTIFWLILAVVAFIATVVWAYLLKNKEDFKSQENLPLEDDTNAS